jgi:hypothetical protein
VLFDKDKDNLLSGEEFINGMCGLFSGHYNALLKLIFEFYDFDGDGVVTTDDLKLLLSYIPLNTYQFNENYEDRLQAQAEIKGILEKIELKVMEFNDFVYIIENVCSDIFVYVSFIGIYLKLLIFLFESKPFNLRVFAYFDHELHSSSKTTPLISTGSMQLIASPNIITKFSPSLTLTKSPWMNKRFISDIKEDKKNLLLKYATSSHIQEEDSYLDTEEDVTVSIIPPMKKTCLFQEINKTLKNDDTLGHTVHVKRTISSDTWSAEYEKDSSCYENYMYKLTDDNTIRKVWFRLINRDLLYFKTQSSQVLEGIHNLSGVFITEESPMIIKGIIFYCIGIIFDKKIRKYFTKSLSVYKEWLSVLKKNTKNENVLNDYDIGVVYFINFRKKSVEEDLASSGKQSIN